MEVLLFLLLLGGSARLRISGNDAVVLSSFSVSCRRPHFTPLHSRCCQSMTTRCLHPFNTHRPAHCIVSTNVPGMGVVDQKPVDWCQTFLLLEINRGISVASFRNAPPMMSMHKAYSQSQNIHIRRRPACLKRRSISRFATFSLRSPLIHSTPTQSKHNPFLLQDHIRNDYHDGSA